MTSEIGRERTFTTSNNDIPINHDDDEDVVVGRMVTPQTRPAVPQAPVEPPPKPRPAEPVVGKRRMSVMQDFNQMPPMQLPPRPVPAPVPVPVAVPAPTMQRRDSNHSIPSRPTSGMGSNNSQSPEPKITPNMPTNQQQRLETNKQSPSNYDSARDQMENNDRGQKPQTNGGPQRQTSDDLQKQSERGPVSDQKKTNSEHVTAQNQKSTLKSSQDQKKSVEDSKPVGNQNRRGSVKLDLSKSENGKSAYDKSPSSKTQTVLYRFTRNSSGS